VRSCKAQFVLIRLKPETEPRRLSFGVSCVLIQRVVSKALEFGSKSVFEISCWLSLLDRKNIRDIKPPIVRRDAFPYDLVDFSYKRFQLVAWEEKGFSAHDAEPPFEVRSSYLVVLSCGFGLRTQAFVSRR